MVSKKKETAKAYEVTIADNALRNINEITGYIAFINHQPLNAIKTGDEFFRIFAKIAANPFIYRECDELATQRKIYRKAKCLSWFVIYKIIDRKLLFLELFITQDGHLLLRH